MLHAEPKRTRHFTVDEVLRMAEAGIFDDGEAVELIRGELLVMSPIGPPHTYIERTVRARLERFFPGLVCAGAPVVLSGDSMPEPDISVLAAASPDYAVRHARGDELRLIVEVSRTSLARDHAKVEIYAAGGVPEYWIVDVNNRRVEVHTELQDGVYRLSRVLTENEHLDLPGTDERWLISELLPPPT